MGGYHCSITWQCPTQGFVQAVHGVGGEHARTGAAGGAGAPFDPLDIVVGNGLVRGHDHGVDQILFLVAVHPCLHRAAGDENSGNIEPHGSHEHAGSDFVAIGDTDHGIDGMGVAHILNAVGNQVP